MAHCSIVERDPTIAIAYLLLRTAGDASLLRTLQISWIQVRLEAVPSFARYVGSLAPILSEQKNQPL